MGVCASVPYSYLQEKKKKKEERKDGIDWAR